MSIEQGSIKSGSFTIRLADSLGNIVDPATSENQGTVINTDSITAETMLTVQVAYTASQTAAVVLTPTAGKKVNIVKMIISASGAGTVKFFDNTDSATTAIGPIYTFAANGGVTEHYGNTPWPSAAINNVIKYTSGTGAAGSVWIMYFES